MMGQANREHVSETFRRLLTLYRKPDGSEWGGQDLEDATGGAVTRSYVSTFKKVNIDNPGIAKLEATAGAMGFAPQLWFGEKELTGRALDKAVAAALEDETMAALLREAKMLGPRDRELLLRTSRQISPPTEGG